MPDLVPDLGPLRIRCRGSLEETFEPRTQLRLIG